MVALRFWMNYWNDDEAGSREFAINVPRLRAQPQTSSSEVGKYAGADQ